ncbi:MAG: alpha/beta hydrolase, partial [Bacteroidales bacterium]|nr:alpha/beta hydrolase [Bacteroidales bacterium]
MKYDSFFVDEIRCHTAISGEGGPVVYWGMLKGKDHIEELGENVSELLPGENFCIAGFEPSDWNGDFSPWPAPPIFGKDKFAGRASETARWLTEKYMPEISSIYHSSVQYIAGYSLSALFALWLYRSVPGMNFDGIAACSPSLWYPGWKEWWNTLPQLQTNCAIYLSLGKDEEKTRNRQIASVGDVTRGLYGQLSAIEGLRSTLEW